MLSPSLERDLRAELAAQEDERHPVQINDDGAIVVEMQPERFHSLLGFLRSARLDKALLGYSTDDWFAAPGTPKKAVA